MLFERDVFAACPREIENGSEADSGDDEHETDDCNDRSEAFQHLSSRTRHFRSVSQTPKS